MNEPTDTERPTTAAAPPEDTLILTPESWTQRLDLPAMFPVERRLEIELGSGDGGFMLQWAESNPGTNFIAVERLLGRVRKLDRKGRKAGLDNLRIARIEASYFMDWLLPPAAADAVHIYFPDPWPKKRHHKRRLIDAAFLGTLKSSLKPGGVVHLRTDNTDYFAVMLEVFAEDEAFDQIETPAALLEVKTDFEKFFNSDGIPTNHASYRFALA